MMTEFRNGMWEVLRKLANSNSIILAVIFFIGHVLIAMTVIKLMTGASIWEAGAVAIVEPAINSVWFYVLHKLWSKLKND
jgi:uncharacterized membrane protein